MRIIILFAIVCSCLALDNGLGLTPPMGYSSWNDCGSSVNETWIKRTADYLLSSGLAAKGYNHVNVDEGWMLGRDPDTLLPVTDENLFPNGMKSLGQHIHSLGLKYGLYTCRGPTQCDTPEYRDRCLHTAPNDPVGCEGSQGFEASDGKWMVDQGADYIKEDSCSATQNHSEAVAQYALMRDVLNKTGRPVYFSLCGWEPWYAPPDSSINYPGGQSLGNSYRIHGDGRNWDALSGAVNVMANLTQFTGPGGWNDPDLLIGPWCGIDHDQSRCGQTDLQARTQFTLWSIFPAPLLISQNMLIWSDYALETYSNTEAIALNQEPGGSAAIRLQGGELVGPATGCEGAGGEVDNCINVWGRQLRTGGRIVIALVNNAQNELNVACDAACFARLGVDAGLKFQARDLWAHAAADVMGVGPSLSASVPGLGGHRLFVLTPV